MCTLEHLVAYSGLLSSVPIVVSNGTCMTVILICILSLSPPSRSLAYSTLADLVHHIRAHLPLSHLSLAVHLFSKNVHDDSLPISIQTISCKLLLNLVECIRLKAEQEPAMRVN